MTNSIVDELGRIPMSPYLTATLSRAASNADTQAHRWVTVEHLLLALSEDPEASVVLKASGVDVGRLTSDVAAYLSRIEDRLEPGATSVLISPDLKRILEAAAAAASHGRRREINGAIVLAAIVGEGKSAAAQMLRAQGLTFEEAIRALQKSHTEPAPAPAPAKKEVHSTDEILANARERVQTRTAPPPPSVQSPAPSMEAAQVNPEQAQPVPVPVPEAPARAFPNPDAQGRHPDAAFRNAPPEPPAGRWVPAPSPAPRDTGASRPTNPPPPPISPSAPAPAPMRFPGGVYAPPPPAPQSQPGITPADVARGPAGGMRAPPPWADGVTPQPPVRPRGVGSAAPPSYPPVSRADPQRQAGRHAVQAGQLVENIPRSMRVAVPVLVEARVARASVRALGEGLQGPGMPHTHSVLVSKAMSVRLRAPDGGFYIETASPETQWIENVAGVLTDDYASWRWTVTPKERGKRRLQLILSARTVNADGLIADTALPDQVVEVRVGINYSEVARRWSGWMVAAVAGGLLARFGEDAYSAGRAVLDKLISG